MFFVFLNTMKQKLIYLLIIPLFAFTLHKFHLSLTKINFNKKEQAVQITMRCFIDDIENTVNKKENCNLELDTKLESKKSDSLLQNYLLQNFKISINKEKTKWNYIGKEYSNDIVYFYLEIDSVSTISSIQVENKVLLNDFDDQQNVIKLNINNQQKTFLLKNNSFLKSFNFN